MFDEASITSELQSQSYGKLCPLPNAACQAWERLKEALRAAEGLKVRHGASWFTVHLVYSLILVPLPRHVHVEIECLEELGI